MRNKLNRWELWAPYVVAVVCVLFTLGSKPDPSPEPKPAPIKESFTPLPTPDPITQEGIYLFLAGRYTKAIQKYQKAIEASPDSPIPYAHSANAHVRLKKYPQAVSLARKSLELNPKESLAMLVLIDVEFRQGRYRGAIELADRYQEPIGGWAKSRLYRTRALSYSALKQFERAIADGQRALELNPADPENYCALMGFYAAIEDDRILEILDAAKELFPWEDCVKEIDRILNQAGWI